MGVPLAKRESVKIIERLLPSHCQSSLSLNTVIRLYLGDRTPFVGSSKWNIVLLFFFFVFIKALQACSV